MRPTIEKISKCFKLLPTEYRLKCKNNNTKHLYTTVTKLKNTESKNMYSVLDRNHINTERLKDDLLNINKDYFALTVDKGYPKANT